MKGIKLAKQTLDTLNSTQQEVDGNISTMPIEQLVVLGQRLWWIVKRANQILDVIKHRLREEATQFPDRGSITHRFEAVEDETHSLVIPSSPQLTINGTTDMDKLKAELGPLFDEYFVTVTTHKPRKDFQVAVRQCDPKVQAILMGAINVNQRTSRVVFKD
jgi:hypothetical protein